VTISIRLTVNGTPHDAAIDPRTPLVHVLRDTLGLTGTRFGCLTGHCGACTVLLNGRAVKSCTVLAAGAEGDDVVTVEGLAQHGRLHPVQQALWDEFGFQCGFCTAGMAMAVVELLADHPQPSDDEIRAGLAGNLCRCTGYQTIVRAVAAAAARMRGTE